MSGQPFAGLDPDDPLVPVMRALYAERYSKPPRPREDPDKRARTLLAELEAYEDEWLTPRRGHGEGERRHLRAVS